MPKPKIIQNVQRQVATSNLEEGLTNVNENKKRIIDLLESQKEQIKKAFPKDINVDRVIRIIITALSKEPTLTKCSPLSILGCAIQSAQLGLEVDSVLGQCFFVPYYNSNKRIYEAQLIVGYRGYIDLAYRSGMIKSIFANVVMKGDKLEYEYGNLQKLQHIPQMSDNVNRGWDEIIGAYAYIMTIQGGFVYKILDKSEITIARVYSKTTHEKSAWNTRPNIMSMKTAIRQLTKYTPLSPSLRVVDMLESMYEGEGQDWSEIIDINLTESNGGNNESIQKSVEGEDNSKREIAETNSDQDKANGQKDSIEGLSKDKKEVSGATGSKEGLFE